MAQRHVIDIEPVEDARLATSAGGPSHAAPAPGRMLPAVKPSAPVAVAPAAVSAPPAPAYGAPPVMAMSQTVINMAPRKSVAGAVFLAFLIGPLGMLYSTVTGAIVMFFVNIAAVVLTLGLGLIVTIPIGMIWAGVAASSHNDQVGAAFNHQMVASVPALAPHPPY